MLRLRSEKGCLDGYGCKVMVVLIWGREIWGIWGWIDILLVVLYVFYDWIYSD